MIQLIEVIYIVNGTAKTDLFNAESSGVTMQLEGTSVEIKNGVRVEIKGSEVTRVPILSALYRNAEVVYRYLTED